MINNYLNRNICIPLNVNWLKGNFTGREFFKSLLENTLIKFVNKIQDTYKARGIGTWSNKIQISKKEKLEAGLGLQNGEI